MVRGTELEGGVFQDSPERCSTTSFSYLSHFAVVIPDNRTTPCRTGEKGEDESDPPQKSGGHVTLDSGAVFHASIRPHAGSLSSSFIPAGRLGTSPQEGR